MSTDIICNANNKEAHLNVNVKINPNVTLYSSPVLPGKVSFSAGDCILATYVVLAASSKFLFSPMV